MLPGGKSIALLWPHKITCSITVKFLYEFPFVSCSKLWIAVNASRDFSSFLFFKERETTTTTKFYSLISQTFLQVSLITPGAHVLFCPFLNQPSHFTLRRKWLGSNFSLWRAQGCSGNCCLHEQTLHIQNLTKDEERGVIIYGRLLTSGNTAELRHSQK